MEVHVEGEYITQDELTAEMGWHTARSRRPAGRPGRNSSPSDSPQTQESSSKPKPKKNVKAQVLKAGRMPPLPKGEIKIILRPKGGLHISKVGSPTVTAGIFDATQITPAESQEDIICPNAQQNIIVISTPPPAQRRPIRAAVPTIPTKTISAPPKCTLCGGPHPTADKECVAKYKTPYVIRKRLWEQKMTQQYTPQASDFPPPPRTASTSRDPTPAPEQAVPSRDPGRPKKEDKNQESTQSQDAFGIGYTPTPFRKTCTLNTRNDGRHVPHPSSKLTVLPVASPSSTQLNIKTDTASQRLPHKAARSNTLPAS
ncbi:hypothetical protein MTO96_018034 [Rhipicephalus appendiculatus]